jgi:hypothetical protein
MIRRKCRGSNKVDPTAHHCVINGWDYCVEVPNRVLSMKFQNRVLLFIKQKNPKFQLHSVFEVLILFMQAGRRLFFPARRGPAFHYFALSTTKFSVETPP